MTTDQRAGATATTAFTAADQALIDSVDHFLSAGRQLKHWWEHTDANNAYSERFEEALSFNRPDTSFGFFDQAVVDGNTMPVMGNVQDMLYDRPKCPTEQAVAQWTRDQIREFVLRYFMRVSDFRLPQGAVESDHAEPPIYLRPFSLCPPHRAQRIGFGFSQYLYKRRETGEIGKFPEEQRYAIVDMRELDEIYEWIVVEVRIFDFDLTYYPFGGDGPRVVLPLTESSYLVLSRDFILNDDDPDDSGLLGCYGVGYAFIKDPNPGVLAYGPGEFDAGIELLNFRVETDGTTRLKMIFVANRPERIVNVSLDPINVGFNVADFMTFGMSSRWLSPLQNAMERLPLRNNTADPVYTYIWLANLVSGGRAATELCLSKDELHKYFLLQHFMQHYQTAVGSLQTWRQIPDWLNEAELPHWVMTGKSA